MLIVAHIAISARNIVKDYCQNRGQHFVPPPVICKVCCLPHVMKDTIKTNHMTGLVDKALPNLIKMNFGDMRSFSTQLILSLHTPI
jgi:hypothetical protein